MNLKSSTLVFFMLTLMKVFSQCYNPPTYCIPTFTNVNSYSIGLQNVTMGSTINNSTVATGLAPNYFDYTAMAVSDTAGATISFSVQNGSGNTTGARIFIDYNRDGTFSTSSPELVWSSGTTTASAVVSGTFTIPSNQASGVYRIRVTGDLGGQGANPCALGFGEAEDYTLVVRASPTDVVTMGHTSPGKFVLGNNTVSFNFANISNSSISSMTIGYRIGSGTPVTQSLSSLSIAPGAVYNASFSSPLYMSTAGTYNLKVWVSGVNGGSNTTPSNDTLCRTFVICPGLSGTYTINPAGSGSSNFKRIGEADTALINCGVSGPVVFNIAKGTYLERVVFPVIDGVSSTNTITFQSATSTASDVVIKYSATGAANNSTIRLDGASYFKFKDLTITAAGSSFGTALLLNQSSSYDSFFNVVFNGASTTSTSNNMAVISCQSNISFHFDYFGNCTVNNGAYGTYFVSNSTNSLGVASQNLTFYACTFKDQYIYGMYNQYFDGLRLINNRISTSSTYTSYTGMYNYWIMSLDDTKRPVITGNSITGAAGGQGMYNQFFGVNSSVTTIRRALIANNMVHIGSGSATAYGIHSANDYGSDYIHNTINVVTSDNSSNSAAAYFESVNSNTVTAINNIFAGTNGAPALRTGASIGSFTPCNFNDLYSTGTNLAYLSTTGYTTLAAWTSGSGRDANSVSTNPSFTSATNLHISTTNLLTVPVNALVPTDFDNQVRCSFTDIGADYHPSNNDIGISRIVHPNNGVAGPGARDIIVVIKNYGGNTVTSANVSYTDNSTTKTVAWSGSLGTCDSAIVTFTSGNQYTFSGPWSLKFFTDSPNGSTDINASNDTIKRSGCVGLAGNYTINPSGSGSTNFTSFTAAVNAMLSCGIATPVVFTVSASTYNEQVSIPNINGASSVNTVTFDGGNGNASTRILTASTTSGTPYVLRFNNCKNVIFRNITIRSTGTSDAWVAHFMDGSSNRLNNCVVEITGSGATATGSNLIPVVVNGSTSSSTAASTISNNHTVDSCTINAGYYNICTSINASANTLNIFGNKLNEGYQYGFYGLNPYALRLRNNTITLRTAITSNYSIYLQSLNNTGTSYFEVSGNKLTNPGQMGIYLNSCSNSGSEFNQIFNNMIGGGFRYAPGAYGIYLTSSTRNRVYHNSVNLDIATTGTSAAVYVTSGSQNDVRNNTLAVTNTSAVSAFNLYLSSNTVVTDVDYNNYYNKSTSSLVYIGGPSYESYNFKNAFPNGGGANSLSINPYFVSNSDLHTTAACNNAPSVGVKFDFDGVVRALQPDIGADEASGLPNNDIGVTEIISPAYPLSSGTQSIRVVLRNFGNNTVTSANINYRVNGGSVVSESWSGSLGTCDTAQFTFSTQYTFGGGFSSTVVYTSSPNGSSDSRTINDTVKMNLCTAMSGVYTIDPSGSGANNFQSFKSAIDAMACGGITGPVKFIVAAGTYTEQVFVPPITGSSATNTILFEGVNKNNRIITFATSATALYVVQMRSCNNVTFRNFTLRSTGTAAAWVAHFVDGNNNRINNCIVEITGTGATSTSSNIVPVVMNGSASTMSAQSFTADNNTVDSCVINTGYYNIYAAMSFVTYKINIRDNVMNNAYQYSFFLSGNCSPRITGNTINQRIAINTNYGIYIQNCNNTQGNYIEISGNKITNAGQYGIYLTSCSKSGSDYNKIYNNMIGNFRHNNGCAGINLNFVNRAQVYHNSIDMNAVTLSTATNAALMIQGGTANDVVNNHLAVTGNGALNAYPLWLSATSVAGTIDYNNYYNVTSPYLILYGTVPYTSRTFNKAFPNGGGANSISINPMYVSLTDLHSTNTCNTGMNLTSVVSKDIDGSTRSNPPDIGADEVTSSPSNDMGVFKINAPVYPLVNGSQNVNVTLKNYGSNTITSANVSYILNGGTPVTQSWSGSLAPCDTVNFTFTTAANITGATSLKVYTKQPNSTTDPVVKNDTFQYNQCGSLNGTYTIGAGGSYPTFNAAVNAMICGGVSGPVVFKVITGGYYEQVMLSELIGGVSATNTITFQSASGNADDVNLGYNGTSANNFTVNLFNMRYVKFRNMTITALNTSNGTALAITNGSSYDSFSNVTFYGVTTTTNSTSMAVISSPSGVSSFITFNNCRIYNGAYGSYFNSNSNSTSSENLTYNKCSFFNQYVYGIYSQGLVGIKLTNNNIVTNSTLTTYTGIYNNNIYIPADANRPIITSNKISGAASGTGIYNQNVGTGSTITTARRPLIANNMVQIGSNGNASIGIRDAGSSGSDYIFNSVNLGGTSTANSTTAGSFESTANGNVILNNVFSAYNGASAIRINTLAAYRSNYNNLYTTGSTLGYTNATARGNLAAWQTGSTKDTNSVSANPMFSSNTDLHANQSLMNNAGTISSLYSTDIDGQFRCPSGSCPGSSSLPDMGADEFDALTLDAAVNSIDGPTLFCPGAASSNVLVTLRNLGSTTLTSATINWSVNGVAQTSYSWTGSLAQGASVSSVNIGSVTLGGGAQTIRAWMSAPNGGADQNSANDSAIYKPPFTLKGTYTIGGTNPDFRTFNDAVNELNLRGICGPVTFHVRQGLYFDRIQINAISGSSVTNFITFKPDPANTQPAELVIDGNSSSTDNHTIFLNGTKFIAFKNLRITNRSVGTGSFGTVIRFAGTQDSVVFLNNIITGPVTNVASTNFAVINHGTGSANMISRFTLDSNQILNGAYGIYMYGNTNSNASTFEFRNRIRFNQILGAYYRGVESYYQRRTEIIGNKIWLSTASQTGSYGVGMYSNDSFRMERNNINYFGQYGLYLQSANYQFGSGTYRATIQNNLIGGTQTNSSAYGIYIVPTTPGSSYLNIFHNSVSVNSSATGSALFIQQTSTGQYTDLDIRNNSFANFGSGSYICYFYNSPAIPNLTINYNNYYHPAMNLFFAIGTTGYTVPTGGSPTYNANSTGGNPGYINDKTNLHGARAQLNDRAPLIGSCAIDIDGDSRPMSPSTLVDIGGDEYYPPVFDLSVTQFIVPGICTSPQQIAVKVQNLASKKIDSFLMNWRINGVLQTPVKVKTPLTSSSTVNVTLNSSFALTSNTTYKFQFWTYLPNNFKDSIPDNDTLTTNFTFLGNAPAPTTFSAKQCGNGFATLSGQPALPSDSISWYTASSGGTYLGIGSTIKGPYITQTSTFYAQGIRLSKSVRIGSIANTAVNVNQTVPYGGMLNVNVTNTVLLDSMQFRFWYNQPATSYKLYYKTGTFNGNETNPSAWTLLNSGMVTFFNANGMNYGRVSTKGLFLQGGQTYSFYLQSDLTAGPSNSIASMSGGPTVTNNDMSVLGGGSIIIGAFGSTQVLANWHPEMTFIYKNQCANGPRSPITITVKPRPLANLIKGTGFEGQFLAGEKLVPDVAEAGKTVVYEMVPPTGYTNAGHGSTWNVTGVFARTSNGFIVADSEYVVVYPSSSGPGRISFKPQSKLVDSLVRFTINLQDLGPNFCDSFLTRWVMIAPTPQTKFRFKDTLCLGETVSFENLTTIHSGFTSYTWYFGDGDSSDLENPFHDYKTTGTYNVRLVSHSHPWNVLKDTSISLEISEIPDVKFKANNNCEGVPVTFQNLTTIGSGSLAYEWDFGDGSPKATTTNATHLYGNVGGHQVTLKVTSSKGCVASLTKNAYQFARPVADFNPPAAAVCLNNEAAFDNASTIAFGAAGSYWTFGDGLGSTVTDPSHKYNAAGTYNVKLLAVSEFNCKDSIQKPVVIKESPSPDFTGDQFCSRASTTFKNTTPETIANPSYLWTFSDGSTSSFKNPVHKWPSPGIYSATLQAQFSNGCVASVSKNFEVLIQPKAGFSVQDVCSGDNVNLVNQTQGDRGGLKYSWDFGNSATSTLQSPVTVYNPALTTTYTITLVASYPAGCSDTAQKTITVTEVPICDFSIKGHGFLNYTFTPDHTGYSQYEWFFGDGGSSTDVSPAYKYANVSTYQVTLKATNIAGCFCQTTKKLSASTGVDQVASGQGVIIYPNPNTGSFTVLNEAGNTMQVEIYNVSGQLIYSQVSENGNMPVELGDVAKGVYFVKVTANGVTSTHKITVLE